MTALRTLASVASAARRLRLQVVPTQLREVLFECPQCQRVGDTHANTAQPWDSTDACAPNAPQNARTVRAQQFVESTNLRGVPWARIGELVGQRDLAVTANTYTHAMIDESESDYRKLLG